MDMEVFEMIDEYLHSLTVPVVIIRLLLATVCGGVIGFFRSAKKAGSRI